VMGPAAEFHPTGVNSRHSRRGRLKECKPTCIAKFHLNHCATFTSAGRTPNLLTITLSKKGLDSLVFRE
jgi:hypothetical protein